MPSPAHAPLSVAGSGSHSPQRERKLREGRKGPACCASRLELLLQKSCSGRRLQHHVSEPGRMRWRCQARSTSCGVRSSGAAGTIISHRTTVAGRCQWGKRSWPRTIIIVGARLKSSSRAPLHGGLQSQPIRRSCMVAAGQACADPEHEGWVLAGQLSRAFSAPVSARAGLAPPCAREKAWSLQRLPPWTVRCCSLSVYYSSTRGEPRDPKSNDGEREEALTTAFVVPNAK